MQLKIQSTLLAAMLMLTLAACNKETAIPVAEIAKFSITNIFDTPAYDVYINGQAPLSKQNPLVTIASEDGMYLFELKKAGTNEILMDTLLGPLPNSAALQYAWNEPIGLNKFINGNDFQAPSADSTAIIFQNKYSTGDDKVDIIVYKDEDETGDYYQVDSVASAHNIPAGGLSQRIVLPYNKEDGIRMFYGIVVRDSKTGKDIFEDMWASFGGPTNFYTPINWAGPDFCYPGKIEGISINRQTIDYGTGPFEVFGLSSFLRL